MDANERHVSNYDDDSNWQVEAHDNRSAMILRSLGATEVKAPALFTVTPMQLIRYVAQFHGIDIETSKKRRHLSEEVKERKRQQLAAARSKIRA